MMFCNIDMYDRLIFEIFVCNVLGVLLVVDFIEKWLDDCIEKCFESCCGVWGFLLLVILLFLLSLMLESWNFVE